MNLFVDYSGFDYTLAPGVLGAVWNEAPSPGPSDAVALLRDGVEVSRRAVPANSDRVLFDGSWATGNYSVRFFSNGAQVAESSVVNAPGVVTSASDSSNGVQYPIDFKQAPITTAAPSALSSIPIVGGIIDAAGNVALQLPLVGVLVGQAALMTGISPGIIALAGVAVGLYAVGAFDSSGGRRKP